MMTLLFIALSVLQGVCLVWAIRNWQKTRASYEILPIIVIIGLVLDNSIIALGSTIGEGDTLKNLNAVRYIAHSLFTPLLIIWGYGVARRMGLGWAQSKRNHAVFCIIAVAMILLGSYSDIVRLSLEVKAEEGLLRYVNVGGIKGPPIPSIVTIVVLIGVGIAVWRKNKSWGLAVGSIVMFVAAMAGLRFVGLANVGEVVMSGGIIAGENTTIRDGKPHR
jgi:hypothetical protein